jgi:hypothetical protein
MATIGGINVRYLFLVLVLLFIGSSAFASRFTAVKIVDAVSMGASINSSGIDLNQQMIYAIQAVWTGTPAGTLKIQVSNDIVPVASSVVNWTDYTGSSQTLSGSAGDFVWNVLNVGYRWMRLVYTRSSSTGTLNVTYSGKGM